MSGNWSNRSWLLAATLLPATVLPNNFMSNDRNSWGCEPPVAPFTRAHLPSQKVLTNLIFPLIGPCNWKNDYDSPRGSYRHTGIDIKAPMMTPIVAPFRGTIGMKKDSFWIYAPNGWAMLGTHLNDGDPGTHDHKGDRDLMFAPDLEPGQTVEAGQFIGYVGMSGNATGPHLHFELYAPGSGAPMGRIRNPYYSLKRAQVLKQSRILLPQASDKPAKNQFRFQGCVRKTDPHSGKLTVVVLARQDPTGAITPFHHVRYLRVKMSDNALAECGGWEGLSHLPENRTIGLYLSMAAKPDDGTVSRALVSPYGLYTQR